MRDCKIKLQEDQQSFDHQKMERKGRSFHWAKRAKGNSNFKKFYEKKRDTTGGRRETAHMGMTNATAVDEVSEDSFQCFLCHQRNDHVSKDCPNADCEIQYINRKFEDFKAQNEVEDRANPQKKYRVK